MIVQPVPTFAKLNEWKAQIYTGDASSFLLLMNSRLLLRLALIATTFAGGTLAFAQEVPVRSCSRLSGKEKALCEYENHKAYKEMAKNQTPVVAEAPVETAPVLQLPSCARKQGKEKAQCLWENQKLLKASLLSGDETSTKLNIGKGRALGLPNACKNRSGKERAQCIVKFRREGRQG